MPQRFWHKRCLYTVTALTTVLITASGLGLPERHLQLTQGQESPLQLSQVSQNYAYATGGRAGGGSFGSSSSGSSSSSSSSNSSYYGNDYSSGESDGFVLLFGCLVGLFYLIALSMKGEDNTDNSGSRVQNEKTNNIVTVTQVQVAMRYGDGELQRSLNQIAKTSDWQTKHGLNSAMQASIGALLAASKNWRQVRCQSETVRTREEGTRLFQEFSLNERSKFEVESLVNVDGNLQCQDRLPANRPEKDPENDYIVATLILGTAHDRPVISNQVQSADELTSALVRFRKIAPTYLMTYELLWPPQNSSDSLTLEELLIKYPNLHSTDPRKAYVPEGHNAVDSVTS